MRHPNLQLLDTPMINIKQQVLLDEILAPPRLLGTLNTRRFESPAYVPNVMSRLAASTAALPYAADAPVTAGSVGLRMDMADDSDVGRARLNDALRIDPLTGRPRIHIHSSCSGTIRQMLRYCWDDYVAPEKHAQKQFPKQKDDDFPTLLKYLMNDAPTFERASKGDQKLKVR